MTPVSWLLILQNLTSFMLENYLPTAVIFSNLSLRSKLSLEISITFFFFWWQIRTVDIYQHAQRQITGQVTSAFHQFYSQNFMTAIKFWFLLERKIHLLSLDKKCMLSKQKTTTNLLSSSSFSKFVLIVELILPISTTASSSWPWRNKTQS